MVPLRHNGYQALDLYFGDLHNHCDLSYGHGSVADAFRNARLQLDFASVTVHAAWPDIPVDDPDLTYLVDYHKEGFARARENWPAYLDAIETQNTEQRFVTFPSFEWHSSAHGDHCVYFKDCADVPIIEAPDLPALRQALKAADTPAFLIPHHIGYKCGSRGINWQTFTDELSPVVEIFSFHGLSESSQGPYPYLHSMGPRHEHGTAQYGWSRGHVFGVIGSTDHHNAFPGSYGFGRLGVWSESLTRESIWDALSRRCTYALTGDRIELAFTVNGKVMGDICPPAAERWIEATVCAGSAIDYIEVLHNNRLVHQERVLPVSTERGVFKVHLEVGWGERPEDTVWDVHVQAIHGHVQQVEPRFRGHAPTATPQAAGFAYTDWDQLAEDCVWFHTRTRQNPSLHTAATEGVALQIQGSATTRLQATVNGQAYEVSLGELLSGSRTFYLGGFVSPALCFHQAVPQAEYSHRFAFLHRSSSTERDWYYVRVRQRNDQWAWSSPVWVRA